MRFEKLAMATSIAVTQTGPNKILPSHAPYQQQPMRKVAEVAQAAETLDLGETSADIATSAQGFGRREQQTFVLTPLLERKIVVI